METTVSLQEFFSYSLWPIVVVCLLGFVVILVFVICCIAGKRTKKEKQVEVNYKPVPERNLAGLQAMYCKKLDEIALGLQQGSISNRKAYHMTSACIREFVYKATGLRVTNYTLQDIKGLEMPVLEELVTEYYAPEFQRLSQGDIHASIERTRRAIETWT